MKDLDLELYNKYMNGEKDAFETLYNKYKNKIQYFIFNIVKKLRESRRYYPRSIYIHITKQGQRKLKFQILHILSGKKSSIQLH